MKYWTKKCTALLLTLGIVSSLLVGCGGAKTEEKTTDMPPVKTESEETTKTETEVTADGFDWKKYEGSTIEVSFVQHTVSDAIVTKLEEFTDLTGIKVEYSITPEASYFDKISTSLSSRSGSPDLFMSGAYQLWDYSTAGYVQDLNEFLDNSEMIEPNYDFEDFVSSAISALKWDGVPGNVVGQGAQLGLPLAFEIYSLAYNKRAFEEAGLEVPTTYDELLTACDALQGWNGENSYAMAVRGARDWGTIHPGYMSIYASFGAKDFEIEDNKLVSKVNSPEAVAMTEFFVDMIKRGGSTSWAKYTWYDCGADLGAGKAAMMIDADNNGVHQNWPGVAEEAGNIAWTTLPVAKAGDTLNSNYWTWSMAMNEASKNKEAAWYFLMYFTSKDFAKYATIECNSLDPARTSIWNSPEFAELMSVQPGYIDTFNKTIDYTTILFTPQPYFFETTTEWASTLQDIVAGQYGSVQEGMDALKAKMDNAVKDIDLSQY